MSKCILLLFSLFSLSSIAQNVDCNKMANWFFGREMTNSGAPTGQVMHMQFSCPSGNLTSINPTNPGVNYGHEGTAVINDLITGNWMLYSDGNHIVYPTLPSYVGLGGQPSSTQSIAICPIQMCSADSFYVFSNPTGLGSPPGAIMYCRMNLSGNISSQVALPMPSSAQVNSASGLVHGEGMLAIPNAATPGSYWLITRILKNGGSQSTDAIVVYSLTSTGVSIHQVFNANLDSNNDISNSLFSTGGTNFLHNDSRSEIALADGNTSKSVFTLGFDNNSGIISGVASNVQSVTPSGAYDVEYSPNNQYLYYSSYGGASVNALDLSTGVSTTVLSSNIGSNRRGWGLGIGPDGNIYANTVNTSNWTSFNSQIWQITNPNTPAVISAPYQSYSNWLLGNLPTFIELPEFDVSANTDSLCFGDSTQINITTDLTGISVDSIQWYHNGNAISGTNDSTIWISSDGIYSADIVLTGGCIYSTNEVTISYEQDLAINIASYTCDTNALIIDIEICNPTPDTVNVNIPFTIYDDNPFVNTSNILYSNQVNINNPPFSCDTFSISIPNYTGSIYAILNDNGTTTTPYSYSGFPYGGVSECTYLNNVSDTLISCCLDDLIANDTTLCEGSPLTLTSSPSFGGSYLWSSNAQFSDTLSQTNSYSLTILSGSMTYYVQEYDSNCTITDSITVNYTPLPVISAGNDTAVCAGDSLVLTGYNPNSAVLNWNNGVTDGVGFVISTSASYILEGTLNGCTSSDTVSVLVNPLPIFTTSNDTSICLGEQFTFSVNASTSSVVDITPNVQNGVPFTPPSGVNDYIVSVQENGCLAIDTVQLNVQQFPTIQVPSDTTICEGNSLVFVANVTPASATLTWQGGISDGVPFIPVLGNSTYSAIANNNGCITSDTVSVQVNSAPIFTMSSDTMLCQGEPYTLTVNAPASSSINVSPIIPIGSAFVPPLGSNEYVVTVSDNVCESSDTLEILVNEFPTMQIPGDTLICENSFVSLNANVIPSTSSISWSGGVSNGIPFTPTLGISNYSIIADNQGCLDSAQIQITVVPGPTLNVTSIPPSPCFPDSGALFIEGTGFNPLSFYLNSQLTSQVVTGLSDGNYVIEVFDSLGCSSSQSITFQPTTPPTASFNMSPQGSISVGDDLQLTNLTEGAIDFWWLFEGENYNQSSQDSVLSWLFPSVEGNYSVCLIVQFDIDCFDTVCATISVSEELLLFVPNAFTPDGGALNNIFIPVFSNPELLGAYKLEIYNRWGELIWFSFDYSKGWDGTFEGKVVQDGTYTWKINYSENNSEPKSFVGHINLIK